MLSLCLLIGPGAGGCGSAPASAMKPRPLLGLHIQCQPNDAQIFVDDRYMGAVKGLDKDLLKLSPGTHRIEIRRDGYFAHFAEVSLEKGVRQRLEVKLRKEPF